MLTKNRMMIEAVLVGLSGTLGLLLFYLALVGITSWSFSHALELLQVDRYYVGAISLGFGLQLGLHKYYKALVKNCQDKASTIATAAGTGTSTASMVACCAHHIADVAPLIGSSGIAIFFNDYKYEMMVLGIAINMIGVIISVNKIYKHQRLHISVVNAS